MSRVINVDATQAEVLAACARRGATVSAIEDLASGGTRVVLMNADATAEITRAFGRKVLTGDVRRHPLRGWALQMDLPRTGTRSSASTITFAHAFRLGQDSRELPAGTYAIHTEQAIHQGAFGPVAVATNVDLLVEDGASRSTRVVRPADLRAALARDGARDSLVDEISGNPDRGRATECSSKDHAGGRANI